MNIKEENKVSEKERAKETPEVIELKEKLLKEWKEPKI